MALSIFEIISWTCIFASVFAAGSVGWGSQVLKLPRTLLNLWQNSSADFVESLFRCALRKILLFRSCWNHGTILGHTRCRYHEGQGGGCRGQSRRPTVAAQPVPVHPCLGARELGVRMTVVMVHFICSSACAPIFLMLAESWCRAPLLLLAWRTCRTKASRQALYRLFLHTYKQIPPRLHQLNELC